MLDRPRSAVVILAAVYFLVLATITNLKVVGFTAEHDLGIFAQYLWLLGHGHEPFGTIPLRSMLDEHFEPTFALLAPLGTLGLQAGGLLVVQAFSLALVAPLLYALARRHGASGGLAAVPAVLWLASPVVVKVNLFEYHPDTLIPPLLAGAVLALEARRERLFVALLLLGIGVKEDAGFTIAALGIVLAWTGRRRLGVAVALTAAAWSTLLMFVVMPRWNPIVREYFAELFAGDRGDGLAGVIAFSARHPLETVGSTLTLGKLEILALLVASTGGLCLLAVRWMLIAVPVAATNLLSAYDAQASLEYHYWIVPVTGLGLAAAVGAGHLRERLRRPWLRGSAIVGVLLAILSFNALWTTIDEIHDAWPKRADRLAIVRAVPSGASVSLPQYYYARLSNRRWMFALPEPFEPAQPATTWGPAERKAAVANLDAVVFDEAEPGDISTATLEQLGFRPTLRRGDVTLYLRAG
ncbi:MAG: DUF2079 domain-containing protein [Gaiellales bacterium]